MKQLVFLLTLLLSIHTYTYAQSVDDAVFATEVTYEILNYEGHPYTPIMRLCKDPQTKEYYHLSNFEDGSDSCLAFHLGTLDNARTLYNKINEFIIGADSALDAEIIDAKGNKFRLLAPIDEKRIGTFVRIQKEGSVDWGIISKQHLRNFSRVFPED
jgi:hypothetical protein